MSESYDISLEEKVYEVDLGPIVYEITMTPGGGGGGTDDNAIHDNVAAEISAIDEKTSPLSADMLLIEDSADSNNKKMLQISNLPAGTPGADSITNTHLANMAEATVKGRATGVGAGDPQDLNAGQVRTIINVEEGATADQSDSEIKTAYENNADTNAFTDADETNLDANTTHRTSDGKDHSDVVLNNTHRGQTDNPHSVDAADVNCLPLDNTTPFTPDADYEPATKKYVDDNGGGTDDDAIHDNVAAEISAVTEKATPVSADLVLIEDSADSNNKKRVQLGNLPAGAAEHGNHTGDVTSVGLVTTIPDETVTYAKMQEVSASQRIMGRDTAGAGIMEELDAATARGILGVEAGATADQTGAEIKALYEVEANAFTDAQFTKLAGIDTGATDDQTGAEIKALYEVEANAFTDAQFTKLAGIDTGATDDQTGAEIKALYEAELDTNAFTDADETNLDANTVHRGSDGKNHSDVVLNNTHRGSDGKDHSDVVLNNTHRGQTDNPHAVDADDVNCLAKDNVGIFTPTGDYHPATKKYVDDNGGGTDDDAIHDNVASEISAITEKTSPVGADMVLIEDSAAANAKKMVQITNLPGGADADAIHDNTANEISAIAEKTTPASADVLVIEDSAASYVKKKVQITNLPAGTPGTDSITNVHLANMVEASIKGRAAGAGTDDPQDLNAGQVRTIIDVEEGATADQTGAEIKALYEVEANAFTDAQFTKLAGIDTGATDDQTGAEIKALYELELNAFTDAQFTKLAGIDTGATDDQTGAEIKALYEAELDTNAFTDADETNLDANTAARHDESHTVASHSDTTATGLELDELTDGSETTLHSHAAGGGDVTAGAHADNRVAVWTAIANEIEGLTGLTFDGSTLGVTGDVDLSGDIHIGTGDGDHYVYFYEGTSEGAWVGFDNTMNRIRFSHSIYTDNDIHGGDNWYVNSAATADGDSYIYFYDGGVLNGEYMMWDDSHDRFAFSSSINITGDVQATGAHTSLLDRARVATNSSVGTAATISPGATSGSSPSRLYILSGLTGTATLTVATTGAADGDSCVLRINPSTYTIGTWTNVDWGDDGAPTLTASKWNYVTLIWNNSSGNWDGFAGSMGFSLT